MSKRGAQPLSARFIRNVKTPGEYGDGYGSCGLRLRVSHTKRSGLTKRYVQRILWRGKKSNLGLGVYPEVSLSEARDVARQNRALLRRGIHPRRQDKATIPTFADASATYIDIHFGSRAMSKGKAAEWQSLLRREANPVIGRLRVDEITSTDVEDTLRSSWEKRHKTSRRLQRMISKVMLWAVDCGHRSDDPANYEVISALMPPVATGVNHMAAVPHESVGPAVVAMMEADAHPTTRLCDLFILLTACRSQEARLATWDEIDRASAMWTMPAEHTKRGREHCVPLSRGALKVLNLAEAMAGPPLIFPSPTDPLKPLSANGVRKLLKKFDPEPTIHGFRSTFRTWGNDFEVPDEVGRAALSHRKEDPMDEIYDRSDLVDARRVAMAKWDSYVEGQIPGGWEAVLTPVDRRVRGKDICQRIRDRRHEWDISQIDLAELLDVSGDIIRRGESGIVPRSGRVLQALEEWLEQDVPVLQDLGPRMKEARKTWFLTQERLSDRLEISRETIARLERGANPSPATRDLVVNWLAEPVPEHLLRLWEQREMLEQQPGPRIRAKRIEWGMSYSAAGAYLGVSGATVGDWEKEKYAVPDRHLPAVIAWLEAPITDRPKSGRETAHAEARTIVERMTRERKRLGISLEKLAKILGVHKNLIWQWERGIHVPRPDSLRSVVHWLERVQKDEYSSPAA